jgi:hypothetical protein
MRSTVPGERQDGDETASPIKVLLIAGIIGCIVDLKVVS